MITHQIDQNGIYTASVECDPFGPIPRGTQIEPPELTGTQVARWIVTGWEVLPEYPHPPMAQITAEDIAARRFDAETSGTVISGMPIDTGRDSQALITGAAVSAILDPGYTVRWKTRSGFVDLAAEQIIAVASAVRAHVQACFDREAELLAELDADTFTPEMLEEGWPNESVPEPA